MLQFPISVYLGSPLRPVSSIYLSTYSLSRADSQLTGLTASIDSGNIKVRCKGERWCWCSWADPTWKGVSESLQSFVFPKLEKNLCALLMGLWPALGTRWTSSSSIPQDATLQLLPTFWGSIVLSSRECGKLLWSIRITSGAHRVQGESRRKEMLTQDYSTDRFWRHAERNKLVTISTLTWDTGVAMTVNTVNLVGLLKSQTFGHICGGLSRFGWGEVIYPKCE